MKKCYYFVAKYVKNGITRICTGTQETIEGYFDFVSAGNFIANEHNVGGTSTCSNVPDIESFPPIEGSPNPIWAS